VVADIKESGYQGLNLLMKWSNVTIRDLINGVVHKLSLEASQTKRRSPHPVYWYVLDGKKVLRIMMPNVHGSSDSISTGFLQQIKRQLMLTTKQFEALVSCPLTAEEFEAIIRKTLDDYTQRM
jgi:hypothetical protein